jgi:hypothetical protein
MFQQHDRHVTVIAGGARAIQTRRLKQALAPSVRLAAAGSTIALKGRVLALRGGIGSIRAADDEKRERTAAGGCWEAGAIGRDHA